MKFIKSISTLRNNWTKDQQVVVFKVFYHFRNSSNLLFLAENCGPLDDIIIIENGKKRELQYFVEKICRRPDCPDWMKSNVRNLPSPTKYTSNDNQFSINQFCELLINSPSVKARFEEARVTADRQAEILKLLEDNHWCPLLKAATNKKEKKLTGSLAYAYMCQSGNEVEEFHHYIEQSFMVQGIEKDGVTAHR